MIKQSNLVDIEKAVGRDIEGKLYLKVDIDKYHITLYYSTEIHDPELNVPYYAKTFYSL